MQHEYYKALRIRSVNTYHPNIWKQTKPLIIIMKWKCVSCEIEDFVETHLCKLRGTLRSRVLSSLLRSILLTFRLLFCRWKASRDMFWLLVKFKANRLLNTRTLPCRTYTVPTHSFGVRMDNPSVFYAADTVPYTPWTIAYWLWLLVCQQVGVLHIDTYCPL